jgi:hypothetical protein
MIIFFSIDHGIELHLRVTVPDRKYKSHCLVNKGYLKMQSTKSFDLEQPKLLSVQVDGVRIVSFIHTNSSRFHNIQNILFKIYIISIVDLSCAAVRKDILSLFLFAYVRSTARHAILAVRYCL